MPERHSGRVFVVAIGAAALALALSMAGGAYAAGLAKNSVASKQIKNNSVSTKDIKDGTLTGADIDEATLGQVPAAADATTLAGRTAASFAPAGPGTQGGFLEGTPLNLVVPGYGTFYLQCNDNGTPAIATDDTVRYGYTGLPNGALTGITVSVAGTGAADTEQHIIGPAVFNDSPPNLTDSRLSADHLVRYPDGKAIRITAYGFDDPTTTGCLGFMEAEILR